MILTTDTELHALTEAMHAKRRKGTTTQAVPVEALEHIVKDHHTLLQALRDRRLLAITLGEDQESLA
ncbi:MAG: hypothetical protein EPO10_29700 [Reyranella sp.]|uniref:hypothetical protein n=1 Tax=Reyranella sp. TaxID=1929291 RepID=UPI001221439F|nr:hypothetical protein [Reyranella sp.]TAJ97172.1 MAG: hypothetical protein EPO41_04040 [Reyranella sp.]TBR21558.1 MAG: hypothetical protein EPO10_29700 [Reyranella sp.]